MPGAPLFPVSLEIDVAKVFGSTVVDPSTWVNKSSAVIETWTNGWSTTFWEVDDIASNSGPGGRNATFVFGNGGQQSGRGFHIDPPVPVHGVTDLLPLTLDHACIPDIPSGSPALACV